MDLSGIEPESHACKAHVLPLDYRPRYHHIIPEPESISIFILVSYILSKYFEIHFKLIKLKLR